MKLRPPGFDRASESRRVRPLGSPVGTSGGREANKNFGLRCRCDDGQVGTCGSVQQNVPTVEGLQEGGKSLWGFTGMDLVEAFASAQDVMGLAPKYHLYTMRHSGPSHDRAARVRSLVEVQKRGRWKSIQNCWRYEKAIMGQLQHQRLSHQQKEFTIFCRRHLEKLLTIGDKSKLPRHLDDIDRVKPFFEAYKQS